MTKTSISWNRAWPAIMLLAIAVSLGLSSPGINVWAWYQSPISPVSPVMPETTPAPAPTLTPLPATSTPAPESPAPPDVPPPQSSPRTTLILVAGGIVLAGLIAGAAVLLMRGQPPGDSTS